TCPRSRARRPARGHRPTDWLARTSARARGEGRSRGSERCPLAPALSEDGGRAEASRTFASKGCGEKASEAHATRHGRVLTEQGSGASGTRALETAPSRHREAPCRRRRAHRLHARPLVRVDSRARELAE